MKRKVLAPPDKGEDPRAELQEEEECDNCGRTFDPTLLRVDADGNVLCPKCLKK